MTIILRAVAFGIAIAALVDPAVRVPRPAPLAVHVQSERGTDARAEDVVARLRSALGARARVGRTASGSPPSDGGRPDEVVLVGTRIDPAAVPDDVPVSTVAPPADGVRIVAVTNPREALLGDSLTVEVDADGVDVAGGTTIFALEQRGVEVGRVEHAWKRDGRARVSLPYVAASAGVQHLRIAARSAAGRGGAAGAHADARIVVTDRRLRVAVYEPRPSWASAFVRTALEGDPRFDVASVVRPSRGVAVRSGAAPPALTARHLEGFQAVLVGAPEDLSATESTALETFAARRGGAVVLLPDRRPSGPYARLLPARSFEEVLLDAPTLMGPEGGVRLRGSEFALPAGPNAGQVLVDVRHGSTTRPVVVWWPSGEGRVMFSGALDAWRYRGRDDGAFGRFWRGVVADAALAAPGPVELDLEPGVAAPGSPVRIRARLRRTEYNPDETGITFPAVGGQLIDGRGTSVPVRLWPAAEPGSFEGRIDAPAEGMYDVHVRTDSGARADTTLIVRSGAALPPGNDRDLLPALARATGGVAASTADLSPVIDRLRGRSRVAVPVEVRPMRSVWWIVPFAGTLCAEWAIRRRRGLR